MANVLVVEDDPGVQGYLRRALRLGGFAVRVADNGGQGLIMAEEQRPDVVILDYNLPGLDGIQVLGKLRQLYADLPVLLITGRDDPNIQREAYRAGAKDFALKPILPVDLIHRVSTYL